MLYYKIWVTATGYQKREPLTYSCEDELSPGQLVEVSVKNNKCLGFVCENTPEPNFKALPVARYFDFSIPNNNLELHTWLTQYYPAPSSSITQLFIPKKMLKNPTPTSSLYVRASNLSRMPPLTREQRDSVAKIKSSKGKTVLLHGDTGTGKTRVYAELAEIARKDGKSSIILTPEIGLTPQLQQTFEKAFGNRVMVNHSKLTDMERRKIWMKVATSLDPIVVIGPRSSIFLPVKNLGLIVVDEAHDSSYKQDQAPYYQTTRVAAKMAKIKNIMCVLGTATPNISDYYVLSKNNQPILRMSKPINESIKEPVIRIISRKEKGYFSKSWAFSDELLSEIQATKKKGLSTLVFLNRRGTARVVSCKNCGWQAACPNCDILLAFHHDKNELNCHVCAYHESLPASCPKCNEPEITYKSAGTKALEKELKSYFPEMSIKRFDSDQTKDEDLSSNFAAISQGEVDIIIGTQIIAKGLDLKKLGLVGIPFADSGQYLPDYTADESTFQLLSQVIGRVGRTNRTTKVIIQTYDEKNPTLRYSATKDWSNFYNEQLAERRKHEFPPYVYLLQLFYSSKRESSINEASKKLITKLEQFQGTSVQGPAPRFHRKTGGLYNWQIIIRSRNRNTLLEIIESLPSNWRYNIDPTNLL